MRFGGGKSTIQKAARDAPQTLTRHSSGFEQFCAVIQKSEMLSILDMSGASQANIMFITGFGHRISSDDVIGTMQQVFGADFLGSQQAASMSQRFLEQVLTFGDETFDGALVWDVLQFLTSPVLEETVKQLLRVMRPGGVILAFFNADEKVTQIPIYNYRIQDPKTILAVPRGGNQRAQYFNNRMIERLFEKASSVKFFLTRDHMREVIVRK